ncbi:MAG: nucleotide exchange factor GrpE [Saprospiraceae bacterium]|nr:nucleotide exchange factor GrpE [Saprospiraceae bacterium]
MATEERKQEEQNLPENEVDNTNETMASKEVKSDTDNYQDEEVKEEKPKEKKARKKKISKEAELQNQLEELNDKFLRLYSEFDNYRKRTIKEKSDLYKTASSDLILALLPVLDDFKRANKAFEESDDINAIKEGIELIFNKFKNTLNQKGVKEMETIGEVFDTEFHEAITQIDASEDMKGKIVDEVEKGYFLGEKVLRYAKVVIGK